MGQDEPDEESDSSEELVRRAGLHRRSEHAEQRQREGRKIAPGLHDAQQARIVDVFVQYNGRYVVRGPRGREHVFDRDGTHITTVDRSRRAHHRLVRMGKRTAVTEQQFQKFKDLLT